MESGGEGELGAEVELEAEGEVEDPQDGRGKKRNAGHVVGAGRRERKKLRYEMRQHELHCKQRGAVREKETGDL